MLKRVLCARDDIRWAVHYFKNVQVYKCVTDVDRGSTSIFYHHLKTSVNSSLSLTLKCLPKSEVTQSYDDGLKGTTLICALCYLVFKFVRESFLHFGENLQHFFTRLVGVYLLNIQTNVVLSNSAHFRNDSLKSNVFVKSKTMNQYWQNQIHEIWAALMQPLYKVSTIAYRYI